MNQPTAKQQEEARELATKIMNQIAVGAWQFCSRGWNIENCAKEIDAALSSRDREIREVLEGLRDDDCFDACFLRWMKRYEDSDGFEHSPACLAARGLWNRVNLTEPAQ